MTSLFATPYVSPITGALSIQIMERVPFNDAIQVDVKAVDNVGTFEDVHHVPMCVLDKLFTERVRFANGNRYRLTTVWDYPYYGEARIGASVELVESTPERMGSQKVLKPGSASGNGGVGS